MLIPWPAAQASTTLAEAEKSYQAGDTDKAQSIYQEALKSAASRALPAAFHYNYGTILQRAGAAGPATVHLLRALALTPFDGDVAFNLGLAESARTTSARAIYPAAWISGLPLRAHFVPRLAWWAPVLLASAFLLWSLFPGRSRALRLSAAAGLAFFLTIAALAYIQDRVPVAGLVASAKVKSGPGDSFPEITQLEAGALTNLEEERDGWAKLRFSAPGGEQVGWAPLSTLLVIR